MSKDVEIAKLMPNFDFTDYDRIVWYSTIIILLIFNII